MRSLRARCFRDALTEPVDLGRLDAERVDADEHDPLVAVARYAAERLEPARVVWGVGSLADAVNRRERRDGRVVLGWNPDGAVDRSVTVLQARRPDESAIATLVGYGCHTVTTGPDVPLYSADYPGPLREAVREWTDGECVFFQGAAGNVLPLVCFTESEDEAVRMGRALALEALHAVAGERAWPVQVEREGWGSVTPISLYRRRPVEAEEQPIAVAEERAVFPLQPVPTIEELQRMRTEFDAAVEAACAEGPARVRTAAYHARWAEQTEQKVRAGTAPTELDGPITAIRIGDGVIATGPGEIFTEIGLAVKERSPARTTLYAGYTNGIVTYFPTAAEFPLGGYEPDYGNRSFGQVAQVTPESESILVETAVKLVQEVFA
ncbi:MAG: hypothetical protein JO064_03460 [Actinobacteria bacterium]|nr:hypothetical protein [Actinomycetota bacterium]